MNVKEYIQSGIIESYVLGLATDAERNEFEQMCAEHPEVKAAGDAFERSLEVQLMQDAVAPPVFIRERVLEAIKPVTSESGLQEEVAETPVRRMNGWKWLAAACFIGLLGVGYWAFTTNAKYTELVAKQEAVNKQLQENETELAAMRTDAEMMQKPGVKMAALKGTQNAPQALSTVFWDSTKKEVYLFINNLPQPPSDKQYQLWALFDGKPIDLGMLEVKEKRLLVKMKNVQAAQAFAITLEPKGGSVNPTMEAMYVKGDL